MDRIDSLRATCRPEALLLQLCPQLGDRLVALGAVLETWNVAVELCASTVSNGEI